MSENNFGAYSEYPTEQASERAPQSSPVGMGNPPTEHGLTTQPAQAVQTDDKATSPTNTEAPEPFSFAPSHETNSSKTSKPEAPSNNGAVEWRDSVSSPGPYQTSGRPRLPRPSGKRTHHSIGTNTTPLSVTARSTSPIMVFPPPQDRRLSSMSPYTTASPVASCTYCAIVSSLNPTELQPVFVPEGENVDGRPPKGGFTTLRRGGSLNLIDDSQQLLDLNLDSELLKTVFKTVEHGCLKLSDANSDFNPWDIRVLLMTCFIGQGLKLGLHLQKRPDSSPFRPAKQSEEGSQGPHQLRPCRCCIAAEPAEQRPSNSVTSRCERRLPRSQREWKLYDAIEAAEQEVARHIRLSRTLHDANQVKAQQPNTFGPPSSKDCDIGDKVSKQSPGSVPSTPPMEIESKGDGNDKAPKPFSGSVLPPPPMEIDANGECRDKVKAARVARNAQIMEIISFERRQSSQEMTRSQLGGTPARGLSAADEGTPQDDGWVVVEEEDFVHVRRTI